MVVVLSSPIAFESGEDLEPISPDGLPDCRMVYIRYHRPAPVVSPLERPVYGRGRRGGFGYPGLRLRPLEVADQLEPTLKALKPKIFDVSHPEEITAALELIEKELRTADGSASR